MSTFHPLTDELIALGLNAYEARVYLALLEHSPAGAHLIAKKLSLSRSTVYTALERLVGKGMVGTSYKNEVKQFIAEPPTVIGERLDSQIQDIKNKQARFQELLSDLQFLTRDDALIPNIMFFEGRESLKKIYLGMLRAAKEKQTMCILRDEFVWEPQWSFVFEKEWNDKVTRLREKKQLNYQVLINDSTIEKKHKAYYKTHGTHYQIRLLPKEHALSQFVMYILGDTVSLLSTNKTDLTGIKITNKTIAKNFTNLFQNVWHHAKKLS